MKGSFAALCAPRWLGTVAFATLGLLATSCTSAGQLSAAPSLSGGHYVAMGSSFAAGPGIGMPAETTAERCGRSSDNYAQQLARIHNLDLTDVSCGGATTAHVIGPWNELPAQIDALRPDTMLVTVTVGGNDVNYIGGLMAASCEQPAEGIAARICQGLASRGSADPEARSRALAGAEEDAWQAMRSGLEAIAREVRNRSPRARLVFVDYLSIVPDDGTCSLVPLSDPSAASARTTASRLAAITADVAEETGADLIRASDISREHHACASEPWMYGFVPTDNSGRFAPYHPNLTGMTAVAEALDRLVSR